MKKILMKYGLAALLVIVLALVVVGIFNWEKPERVYLGTVVDFESGGGNYFVLMLDNGEKVAWTGALSSENDLRIGQSVYHAAGWTWVEIDGELY